MSDNKTNITSTERDIMQKRLQKDLENLRQVKFIKISTIDRLGVMCVVCDYAECSIVIPYNYPYQAPMITVGDKTFNFTTWSPSLTLVDLAHFMKVIVMTNPIL